jgi:hypothetical protein
MSTRTIFDTAGWAAQRADTGQRASFTNPCGLCGAKVGELRRGRCWGCYSNWLDLRPVGKGAACLVCNERRRANLRLMEVHGRSLPLCHMCGVKVARLEPVPSSVAALRAALRRDRRSDDRRLGALDTRVFPRERRTDDRRNPVRLSAELGDTVGLDEVIELDIEDIDILEATTVSFTSLLVEPPPTPEAQS